jgi:hypothetical protein
MGDARKARYRDFVREVARQVSLLSQEMLACSGSQKTVMLDKSRNTEGD